MLLKPQYIVGTHKNTGCPKKVEEYFLLKGKNSEIYKLKNKWYVEFLSTFNAENKQRIELKKSNKKFLKN